MRTGDTPLFPLIRSTSLTPLFRRRAAFCCNCPITAPLLPHDCPMTAPWLPHYCPITAPYSRLLLDTRAWQVFLKADGNWHFWRHFNSEDALQAALASSQFRWKVFKDYKERGYVVWSCASTHGVDDVRIQTGAKGSRVYYKRFEPPCGLYLKVTSNCMQGTWLFL